VALSATKKAIPLFIPSEAGITPASQVIELREPEDPVSLAAIRDMRKIRCKTDPSYFINNFILISDPVYGKIAFRLWGYQRRILQKLIYHRLHIILKSRQLGITWLIGAYLLWVVLFYPAKVCMVLSIRDIEAKKVIRRIRFMLKNLPDWLTDHVELVQDNVSVLILRHWDGTESKIESLPATEDAGRSEAASIVFLDEWAIQRWQDEIMTAIKPTISAGGQFIGASTAKGFGNLFSRAWEEAYQGEWDSNVEGTNGFVATFLPWSLRPDRDDAWYVRETKGMLPFNVAQEYPTTPDEAFIQTGSCVFTQGLELKADVIQALPLAAVPAEYRIGGMTVWQRPQRDHRYIVAADCAEGIPGQDYDAALVIDVVTCQQVAELHGYWPDNVYANKLAQLGYYYNTAIVAPERNNHGHSIINTLWHQLNYPKIYRHKDYDKEKDKTILKPGWLTSSKTKPIMIADLEEAIRVGTFRFASPKLLSELRVYSYNENGSMGAQPGYHDDLVIAAAIALQVRKYKPYQVKAQNAAA
jgi:hypothetical protein